MYRLALLQNDAEDWEDVQKSLSSMSITPEEIDSIIYIISGVLLLGNVEIASVEKQGLPNASHIDSKNRQLLIEACELLFLDPSLVEEGLLVKISKAGNQEIRGAWKQDEAIILKDSLAKVRDVIKISEIEVG